MLSLLLSRLASVLPYWLIALLITAAFGVALSTYFPAVTIGDGAIQMLLMAGSGWILTMILALIRLSDWAIYWRQLSRIMLLGVCLLLPYTILQISLGSLSFWLAIVSVSLSSLAMLLYHWLVVKRMEISPVWNWVWFLSLQGTALFWIVFFQTFQL